MRDYSIALGDLELGEVNRTFSSGDGLSPRTKRFLKGRLHDIARKELSEDHGSDTSDFYIAMEQIQAVLEAYWPNIDQSEPNALYIWPVLSKRLEGRSNRQGLRIGRALRKMFPVLTDIEIADLTDEVKSKLLASDLTIHTGIDEHAFTKAYSYDQSDYENLDTTETKKHMANSCMRYKFEHLPKHPAAAYASGDFLSVWAETKDGKIAGRCVVYTAGDVPQPAPIYAATERAYVKIRQYLDSIEAKDPHDASWIGAKLKSIPYEEGYVAPYLDLYPRAVDLSSCGKWLVVTRHGAIDASGYSGVLDNHYCTCEYCDGGIEEGNEYRAADTIACEHCFFEHFFTCEECEEYETLETSCTVYRSSIRGHEIEMTVCECCRDNSYVTTTNWQIWHENDVIYTHDDQALAPDDYENDYFTCWLREEVFHNDDIQWLDTGECVSVVGIEQYNADSSGAVYVYDFGNNNWVLMPSEQEVEKCTA